MIDATRKPDLLDLFGRHLVSLSLSFAVVAAAGGKTSPILKSFSGTLIFIKNKLFYLTAGHIIREIDQRLDSGEVIIEKAYLTDVFGLERKTDQSIPFNYVDAPRMYNDANGLDFGLIGLRRYYQDLLASNGILPVEERSWRNVPSTGFDSYMMLGLPEELMAYDYSESPKLFLSPALIRIEKEEEPPNELAENSIDRFYGRITGDIPLTSISGMSGGPIFGIKVGPPARYWIVAIQSSWLPTTKHIAACPIKTIATLVDEWIDEHDPRKTSEAL
jgi:hypothetical protein